MKNITLSFALFVLAAICLFGVAVFWAFVKKDRENALIMLAGSGFNVYLALNEWKKNQNSSNE